MPAADSVTCMQLCKQQHIALQLWKQSQQPQPAVHDSDDVHVRMHAYTCSTKLACFTTDISRHCKIGKTFGCSVTDQDGADILQHALATERKLRDRNSQLAVPNKSFARVRAICEQQLQQMSGAAQRAAPSRLPGSAAKVSSVDVHNAVQHFHSIHRL